MAGNTDAQIMIGADIEDLRRGLNVSKQEVDEWIRGGLAKIPAATQGANRATEGLLGTLKDFKREQVQQGRLVGFFVKDLVEMSGAGTEAKAAMSGLGQILLEGAAGGSAFGLAFEAVKFTVGMVVEEWRKHKEEVKENIKMANDFAALQSSLWQGVADAMHAPTEGVKALRGAYSEALASAKELDEKIEKMRADGPGAFAWIKTVLAGNSDYQRTAVAQFEERIRLMTEESSRRRAEGLEAGTQAKKNADLNDRIAAGNQLRLERAQILGGALAVAQAQEIQGIRAVKDNEKLSNDEKRIGIGLEYEKLRIAKIKAQFAMAPAEGYEQVGGKSAGEMMDQAARENYAKHAQTPADLRRLELPNGGFTPEQEADSYAQVEIAMAGVTEAHVAASQAAKEHAQETANLQATYQQWGEQIGNTFLRLATGQVSAKQLMAELGRMVAEKMISMVSAEVAAKIVGHAATRPVAMADVSSQAGVAGARAAASVAGIPIIGPELAAAAMAGVSGMILATGLPLASAAGGWRVPDWVTSRGVPTVLHPGEHVLPKRIARNYEGDGGAGQSITLNVQAHDAKSFEGYLRSQDNALIRVITELRRDGRI